MARVVFEYLATVSQSACGIAIGLTLASERLRINRDGMSSGQRQALQSASVDLAGLANVNSTLQALLYSLQQVARRILAANSSQRSGSEGVLDTSMDVACKNLLSRFRIPA